MLTAATSKLSPLFYLNRWSLLFCIAACEALMIALAEDSSFCPSFMPFRSSIRLWDSGGAAVLFSVRLLWGGELAVGFSFFFRPDLDVSNKLAWFDLNNYYWDDCCDCGLFLWLLLLFVPEGVFEENSWSLVFWRTLVVVAGLVLFLFVV